MKTIGFILPLDYGVLRNDKHKNHFIFRDKEAKSKMDYNFYLAEFAKPSKRENTNMFIVYLKDNQLYFDINIFDFGKETISKELNIKNNTILLNTINSNDYNGVGYINEYGEFQKINKEEYDKYNMMYGDIAFLMNSVIEREMINLNNSSFYLSDLGYNTLSNYMNNIYKLYLNWKKDNNEEIINYKQYEYLIKSFLENQTIQSLILTERNNFNKTYALYRLEELERFIHNDKFFAKNAKYFINKKEISFDEEWNRYKDGYKVYKSIPFIKRQMMLQKYYLTNNNNTKYDMELLKDIDFQLKNNKDSFLNKINNISHKEDIQEDIAYTINDYYIKNRGLLTPDYSGSNEDRFLINKYLEEYNHYLYILKDDIFNKSLNMLKDYIKEDISDLKKVYKITNDLLAKQLKLKSDNIDYISKQIIEDKVNNDIYKLNIDENLNKKVINFYKNSFILYYLDKLIITHPNNEYLNGYITPSRFQKHKIKIAGEKNIPGFIIESNMLIPSYMIERGKGLFGVIKDKPINNIIDKYEFYQFFNDIEKVKSKIKELNIEKKAVIDIIIKEQDKYTKSVLEDDKKKNLKQIAHSSNTLNLINQKIEFLSDCISLQKVEMTKTMNLFYENEFKELFIDSDKFKDSYIEAYKRYRQIGRLIRETKDSIENYRLKGNSDKMKTAIKSINKLIKTNILLANYLGRKHGNLNDYIDIFKSAILESNVELINELNIKLSKFEKNMLKQLIIQNKIKYGFIFNNIEIKNNEVIKYDPKEEILLLNNIYELLSYKYISKELYYSIMDTLEYKINNTNDEDIVNKLKEELLLYKNKEFDKLKVVVSDINLYYVEAYDHGDIHKRFRNIIDKEIQNKETTAYDLMDNIIEEYNIRLNPYKYLIKALNIFKLDYDINNLTIEDVNNLGQNLSFIQSELVSYLKTIYKVSNIVNEEKLNREETIQLISQERKFSDELMIETYNRLKNVYNTDEIVSILKNILDIKLEYRKIIINAIKSLNLYIQNNYEFKINKMDEIKQMAIVHLKKSLQKNIPLKEEPKEINTETIAINDKKKVYIYKDGKNVLKTKTKVKKSKLTKYDIINEL